MQWNKVRMPALVHEHTHLCGFGESMRERRNRERLYAMQRDARNRRICYGRASHQQKQQQPLIWLISQLLDNSFSHKSFQSIFCHFSVVILCLTPSARLCLSFFQIVSQLQCCGIDFVKRDGKSTRSYNMHTGQCTMVCVLSWQLARVRDGKKSRWSSVYTGVCRSMNAIHVNRLI